MGTSEITLVISAIVALFGILTFAFARSGDHGKREYVQDTNAVIKKLSAAIVAAGLMGV